MARIKFSKLQETKGILNELSGNNDVLRGRKNGVIFLKSNSPFVKRPNQYNKGRL